MKQLSVIDFFCGAGGFSEGFHQMGFDILYGYDHWKPAVDTFNHNFDLNCEPKNILDFKSIEGILNIPDTDIIIGSPPCVSFSSSNKSGKADKSLGVALTETFLRIIAVKKHQPNSKLKAWFMENVVNSKRYLQPSYTFKDLGLSEWAISHKISPNKIAIELLDNTTSINSADYGAIQSRTRLISGEIIKKKKMIIPPKTHQSKKTAKLNLPLYKSIKLLKQNFPSPFCKKNDNDVFDLQYDLIIKQSHLTDHFYDTGVYEIQWKFSKYWKVNHPYMGKMSFPENIDNPSRTITATKIAHSRESIIYKSEIERVGDGEYRLPTVREAAIIMGFPITYQFLGSENTKWRLIGNAVCCSVSRAFAKVVINELKIKNDNQPKVRLIPKLENVTDLNTYSLRTFDNPPVKNKGARFRRHPIKDGNMTVTLSNYDIDKNSKTKENWYTSIQYGTGEGFPVQKINNGFYKKIEPIIENINGGKRFIEIINNGFSEKIGNRTQLQRMYEKQVCIDNLLEPTLLIDKIPEIIESVGCPNELFEQDEIVIFKNKEKVPISQLFSLYAVNKISSKVNQK